MRHATIDGTMRMFREALLAAPELLRPAPNDLLRMWPISKRVNVSRRSDDDPCLIEPVEGEVNAAGAD
jgi:putative SOS response-associated peptidase YedK